MFDVSPKTEQSSHFRVLDSVVTEPLGSAISFIKSFFESDAVYDNTGKLLLSTEDPMSAFATKTNLMFLWFVFLLFRLGFFDRTSLRICAWFSNAFVVELNPIVTSCNILGALVFIWLLSDSDLAFFSASLWLPTGDSTLSRSSKIVRAVLGSIKGHFFETVYGFSSMGLNTCLLLDSVAFKDPEESPFCLFGFFSLDMASSNLTYFFDH